MSSLPDIVERQNLTHHWWYRDAIASEPFALVVRYDSKERDTWFRQYQLLNGKWTEGAATPLPIFGSHLLQEHHIEENIFIFESEKCAEAAQHLNLTALTSMLGSSKANWAVLARYRQFQRFVLVPSHGEAGKRYMRSVYEEIRKAYPEAEVNICHLLLQGKADDFADWLKGQEVCPAEWSGFQPIDEPAALYLRKAFEAAVEQYSKPAEEYFNDSVLMKPTTFEPFRESVLPVKSCPVHTLPNVIKEWIRIRAEEMQAPVDYLAIPLLVYAGTAIGRKRGVRVRKGTDWIEFPNLWGMIIGRPSLMKSPAMKAVRKPLEYLISKAKTLHEEACSQYVGKLESWKILKKAKEDHMKKSISQRLRGGRAF